MVTFTSEQLWQCLSTVSDPEIPAVSVVDLGIVRELIWQDDETCEVIITPTYSGCPATQVIAESIEQALQSLGVEKIVIRTQLSPAWTTDWMTAAGREKLKAFGIAPIDAFTIFAHGEKVGIRRKVFIIAAVKFFDCMSIRHWSAIVATAKTQFANIPEGIHSISLAKPLLRLLFCIRIIPTLFIKCGIEVSHSDRGLSSQRLAEDQRVDSWDIFAISGCPGATHGIQQHPYCIQ